MPLLELFHPSFQIMYPNTHLSVLGISSEGGLRISQKCPKLEIFPLYVLDFLAKLVNAPEQPVRISNIGR
jgi:hypothetical protein